ncbi:MAG: hypothetical protein ACKVQC_11015 [Elusimicrobiota bacterium]
MGDVSLKLNQSVGLAHQHRLAHRVKLANFISLPEVSFHDLVQQVEKDPLFLHYKSSINNNRIFRYQRYPRTGISTGFLEINEDIVSAPSSGITDQYLSDKKEIIDLCQKIGMDNFKEYFLYNDKDRSLEEISKHCNLSTTGTKKIMELVDKLALDEEFQKSSENPGNSPSSHEHYSKIASIEKDHSGEFTVYYNSLRYGRGRYVIDHEKFDSLKNAPNRAQEEIRYLENLIKTMELINTRKSIIYQTIEKIMDRQRPFLLSKDPGQLNSLTQLEMGREMDIHSSSISRAIYGKSIGMPWGEEIPLKFFFVRGPIHKVKAAIYLLIDHEEKLIGEKKLILPYRDDELRNLLKVEYQMGVAVRTVAKYRADLGIANVYERSINYKTKEVSANEAPSS